MSSKVIVNGPTNTVELNKLMPGEGFIDLQTEQLYIRLNNISVPDGIECFRFTPSDIILLERHLLVRRVNINVDWSFA